MARQRLGQHFLADAGWREEIARAIRVSPQSIAPSLPVDSVNWCWIEIGAGHGEMTEQLASTGVPVHAIELDPQLAASLKRLAKRFPNVEVTSADILETDIAKIAAGRRVRIYGNLPYYITSPILHHLFASAELIEEIHIVIQHEVALRLAAQPGTRDYGYLSVLTQYFSRPELVLEIPRGAFRPPPEVDSALVTLRLPGQRAKLPQINETSFLEFVKLCFSQKRKTLVNNLKARMKTELVRQALANLRLRPDARAEQLSVAHLAALMEQLEMR
ncbi:MAG TPA: 16S rRNA (adenine(1518)-N(6)/adenine(1519)-N(6))-dimethyltransferase RsmA [Candidatus Acidoferrum sp.]|nr:16S rRNA (adenine(1518)-N(6)/adenine(1519)-N(6))-dimethyltransferase RsmA [Candidatus Acidoferrum sp.]